MREEQADGIIAIPFPLFGVTFQASLIHMRVWDVVASGCRSRPHVHPVLLTQSTSSLLTVPLSIIPCNIMITCMGPLFFVLSLSLTPAISRNN